MWWLEPIISPGATQGDNWLSVVLMGFHSLWLFHSNCPQLGNHTSFCGHSMKESFTFHSSFVSPFVYSFRAASNSNWLTVDPVAGLECTMVLPSCFYDSRDLSVSKSWCPLSKLKRRIPLQGRGLLILILVTVLPRRAMQRSLAKLGWKLRWESYKTKSPCSDFTSSGNGWLFYLCVASAE